MSSKIFVLCVVLVSASAAPPVDVVPLEQQQPTVIPIIAQSEELEANGTYKYSYETANGIKREEISYDKVLPSARSGGSSNEGGEDKSDESNEIHVQQGSYSYTAPDGTLISVRYIADENGFRPIGDHLPKPPSILVAASPSRVSGRTAKKTDSDVGSSAPVAAVAAPAKFPSVSAPAASATVSAEAQDTKVPTVESRLANISAGQSSSSASEEPAAPSETPSIVEATSTAEPSTTDSSTPTEKLSTEGISTEQSTTSEPASTTVSEQSTTSEPASTTTSEQSTTSEPASTTVSEQSTTSEPASTTVSEQSTTSELASTTASEQSTTEALSSPTPALSTTGQSSASDLTSTLPASASP